MQRTLSRPQVDVLFDLSDYPPPQGAAAVPPAAPLQEQPLVDNDRAWHDTRFMARSRIRRLATSAREQRDSNWTPEQIVDHRTSMDDARIALCIAMGNALDDIEPSSGYSTSRASYDNARASWIRSIKSHGFSAMYERAPLTRALTFWMERRPQFLAGDDWLAAGLAAHRDYWQGLGRPCNRPTCDEHNPDAEGAR